MHYENPRIKLSEWSLAGAERLRKGGEKNDIRTLEGVLVQAYMLVDGNPQRHPEILAKVDQNSDLTRQWRECDNSRDLWHEAFKSRKSLPLPAAHAHGPVRLSVYAPIIIPRLRFWNLQMFHANSWWKLADIWSGEFDQRVLPCSSLSWHDLSVCLWNSSPPHRLLWAMVTHWGTENFSYVCG